MVLTVRHSLCILGQTGGPCLDLPLPSEYYRALRVETGDQLDEVVECRQVTEFVPLPLVPLHHYPRPVHFTSPPLFAGAS